jgi:hypothetical protein
MSTCLTYPLWHLPAHNVHRLHYLQNSFARFVEGPYSCSFIFPADLLASPHCLSTNTANSTETLYLSTSLHTTAHLYLSSLIHRYTSSRRQLLSSDHNLLSPHHVKTRLASRDFRSPGPRIRNSLPHDLTTLDNYTSFKSHLKTHLFSTAFTSFGH